MKRVSALAMLVSVAVLAVVAAAPAAADTSARYHAVYVEPFPPAPSCPGSCGVATIKPYGAATQVVLFDYYEVGVHRRTITFPDGATLTVKVTDMLDGKPCAFCFVPAGPYPNSPLRLEIVETFVGGTGRFSGAHGSASGTVTLYKTQAVGRTSGSLELP